MQRPSDLDETSARSTFRRAFSLLMARLSLPHPVGLASEAALHKNVSPLTLLLHRSKRQSAYQLLLREPSHDHDWGDG